MCQLRRKLLMFDYTVGKLVEWDTNSELNILTADSINESLQKFTSIGFMKLLYFICLQSVNERINLISYKQTNNIKVMDNDKIDLFRLFDNFVALPKGPAEDDVYSHRSTLLSYRYEDKYYKVNTGYIDSFKFSYPDVKQQDFENKENTNLKILLQQISLADAKKKEEEISLATFKDIIDKTIGKLKIVFAHKKISLTDFDYLVDLSHKLPLWNHYIRCANNKYSLTEEELSKEATLFQSM